MLQTCIWYTVKFGKILQLKSKLNSVKGYMICYIKEIQGLLSTFTKKVLFFKDFKALKNQWWNSSIFQHFKDLYEPQ